ncbi:BppU family phage baseplate upper protein [Collinsella aerofaciens]|uniref:BppU family phage baseplate upper protein n=1 Tax=Collinsella aerofaciens TaxID=74426 RepID=UPI0034A3323A
MAQELTFDTKKPENAFREQRIDPLRRGERGNRELTVSIASKGIPYDLTGCTVRFVGTTGTGQLVGPTEIEVANATAGMVRHVLPAEMSTDAGLAHWYYEIYKGENYLDTTESCSVKVLQNADIGGQQATLYIPILEQAKADEQARTAAETKRADAETARATAETARVEAEKLRAAAETKRVNAETSRVEAEKSRATAETKRDASFTEMSTKLSAAAAAAKAARDDATESATAAKKSKDAAAASALSAGKASDSAATVIKETADAAADARRAAEEARGSISADKSMYFKRITDKNGDTWPVIVDSTVKGD